MVRRREKEGEDRKSEKRAYLKFFLFSVFRNTDGPGEDSVKEF